MTQEERDAIINDAKSMTNDSMLDTAAIFRVVINNEAKWREFNSKLVDKIIEANPVLLDIAYERGITDLQIQNYMRDQLDKMTDSITKNALIEKAYASLQAYNKIRDARLARNKMIRNWTIGIIAVIILGIVIYKFVLKK